MRPSRRGNVPARFAKGYPFDTKGICLAKTGSGLVLLFGVVIAAVLAIFLGAFLILVPAVIVIVFAMTVAGMMRVYFNRLWSSRTAGCGWDDSNAHH
jgi:hypothetical protein